MSERGRAPALGVRRAGDQGLELAGNELDDVGDATSLVVHVTADELSLAG